MLRRLSVLTAAWVVLLALLSAGTAVAQEEGTDEAETPAETASYGDHELIETLRTYGLLDEWVAASPVSAQASLLAVSGNGNYQAQRQVFLNSLHAWADRTERVRTDLARIEAAQQSSDRLRSIINQVRDALVLDDRLTSDSTTLLEIEDGLAQLALVQIPEHTPGESEAPLVLAEIQLKDLRDMTEIELQALNGSEPAVSSSGVGAFVGYEDLSVGLSNVDQLITRSRRTIRPAREQSERLAASALAQIPNLHAARMLGSSDVGGLSVVTVDAYVRAAARSSCSVDWALLAGIGKIESNHGRLGGAFVSRSGQVSTTILGPLLDGGETARDQDEALQSEERDASAAPPTDTPRPATPAAPNASLWGLLRGLDGGTIDGELGSDGNGFAIVVDSDGGRLDGNAQWDRAIGPMQFIPETWSKWATDGNGDGVADPHNLYDASASAARFLCHLSATRGASPSSFLLGYNDSTSYARSVLATAQALRATPLPTP